MVAALLQSIGQDSVLKILKTQGDRIQHLSFDKIEGKGFFTKELEEALLQETVDIAVHSLKDLPTTSPDGLCIAAIPDRADPADCLIIAEQGLNPAASLNLRLSATVGTSSIRRKKQFEQLRPDCVLKDLRGNVPTRIEKLKDGRYDAIILAAAGMKRLDLPMNDVTVIPLNPMEFVPAPGQGAIAVQCRRSDMQIRRILKQIHNPGISACTNVERGVLRAMDGGCHLPLGVYCQRDANGHYHVRVSYIQEHAFYTNYSVSTSFGLVDRIVNELKQQL